MEQNSCCIFGTHQQLCVIQTEHSRKEEGGGSCKETFVTLPILLYTSPEEKTEYSLSLQYKRMELSGDGHESKAQLISNPVEGGLPYKMKVLCKHFNNNSLYFSSFSFWLLDPTREGRRGRGVLNGSKRTSH